MRVLLRILLEIGLLLQAIDIILAPHRKAMIKQQFTLVSSQLANYSLKELALWSLARFSLMLGHLFARQPFSFQGIRVIMLMHALIFASLFLVLVIVTRFYERSFDELSFMIMFYSSLVHVYASFGADLVTLLQIKRDVVQEHFIAMMDLATLVYFFTFVFAELLAILCLTRSDQNDTTHRTNKEQHEEGRNAFVR